MIEYRENDYLNYTDLNEIENKIIEIHNNIYLKYGKVAFEPNPPYIWQLNAIVYKSKILNILEDIQNFKDYYLNFDGFRDLKKYYNYNTMNYKEINDIINDLNVIDINEIENKNIWDYRYLLIWNENSTTEWEE